MADAQRRLVVTSDDLGMTLAVNRGIEAALARGALTGTNIMVPCPWFEHAARAFARTPADLGVHFTLTCEWANYTWRPLTQAASLLDSGGRMHRTVAALMEHARADDIRAECRAQLALALRRGLPINYVDVHMCIPLLETRGGQLHAVNAGHEMALMRIVEAVGRESGLEYPYALDGDRLRHFQSALSISGKGREAVERYIEALAPGLHHLSCHCAVEAAEQRELSPEDSPEYPWSLPYRLDDYATVTSPWFAALLRSRGVELAGMPWSNRGLPAQAQA
jgi:chitin disaccharide deacetylase